MTDSQFEELLAEAITDYGGEYIDVPEEMEKPHRFTRSFKKRMQKLIWTERGIRPPRKRLSLRMLIVVIVTAVIAASSVMTVSAFREEIIGFITDVYNTFTNVQAEPDEEAPDTLEEIYEVTWVPEGFTLTEDYLLDVEHKMVYQNELSYIRFGQYLSADYNRNYDSEEYDLQKLTIDSIEVLGVVEDSELILVWTNNGYVFELSISSGIDINQAINIAKSVQKVETP